MPTTSGKSPADVPSDAVTDEELALARRDPAFRRRLLANKLDYLLGALARMRACESANEPEPARQIAEGVELAVKLAQILQESSGKASSTG